VRTVVGTHVYVAQAGDLMKIGATGSLGLRTLAVHNYGGRRFEIVDKWPHSDPFAIELMVITSLASGGVRAVHRREAYAVTQKAMRDEVVRAIDAYNRYQLSRETTAAELKALIRHARWFFKP
jgi:1-deoxy-D-xylulose 5-phosphate reductoisomerase